MVLLMGAFLASQFWGNYQYLTLGGASRRYKQAPCIDVRVQAKSSDLHNKKVNRKFDFQYAHFFVGA